MSAFAKIAGAPMTGGGSSIRDGFYKFLVEKITYQKGHSGEVFIAELRVMESKSDGSVDDQGKPVVPNAVGSTCSLVCNLTKHESAASNAKKFAFGVLAGLGYTEDKIDEKLMMDICDAKNPLRGAQVYDATYRVLNQGKSNPANRGKPLTLHNWKSVVQTAEDVKKNRAFLDSNIARPEPAAAPAVASVAPASSGFGGQETPTTTPPQGGGVLDGLLK